MSYNIHDYYNNNGFVVKYAEHIKQIECMNSGGNVMLDILTLDSGKILVISDEVICLYKSYEEFESGNYEDAKCMEV